MKKDLAINILTRIIILIISFTMGVIIALIYRILT